MNATNTAGELAAQPSILITNLFVRLAYRF
jgi:hypothetical protein